jgi:nucleotide-binding universal stress UspA family protein
MESDRFKILVGIDFSPSSAWALDYAVRLARRLSGELDLMHVFPFTAAGALAELVLAKDDIGQLTLAKDELARARDALVPKELTARVHMRLGDPVGGLLDGAAALGADLIVVGSHGRGAVMRTLLGSVSEKLARRSAVPLVVVPSAERARAAVESESVDAATVGQVARVESGEWVTWSCDGCGHIRGRLDETKCHHCGASPAIWNSATLVKGPVDVEAPAVGRETVHDEARPSTCVAGELFALAPPGAENTNVNPELRVRY